MVKKQYYISGNVYDMNGCYVGSVDNTTWADNDVKASSNVLYRWKTNNRVPVHHKYILKKTLVDIIEE